MIRYPGSKDKIADELMAHFPVAMIDEIFQRRDMPIEYREPFVGGGHIAIRVLDRLPSRCRVWLNDKDFGLVCLWRSVYQDPRSLMKRVKAYKPSVDDFYRFKEEDGRLDLDPVETGFRKLALHQTSFSGLGAMAGGPIGGRGQRSEFNVDCRWNGTRHCLDIERIHRLFSRFRRLEITSGDFTKLIDGAPSYAFIYADPPYYAAGPELYKYCFGDDDHRRLGEALRRCVAPWVLSYDDHPFIRELYSWAKFDSVSLTYSSAVAKESRRKNQEVVITPPSRDDEVAA